ncbi:hypothetical protein T552_01286 [Pneumocystis carinii B80]|uniref:Transcriptional regulatory protein DEP1 n=1 Tax=Pneumocystis carinii (strain B80) TaxID=1408658 RepID=A0A0W4ZLT3_PNEC8|nr:hypothetical protein T552_01286 [Pneumocystis carinii B80]KTW29331.1 hypothetical protein T552_01286 [Pneumocystis carinii B80]
MPRGRGRPHDREVIVEKGAVSGQNSGEIWTGKRLRRGCGRISKKGQETISGPVFTRSPVFRENYIAEESLKDQGSSKNAYILYESKYKNSKENMLVGESIIDERNEMRQENMNELEAISVLNEFSNSVSMMESSYIKKSKNSNSDDDLSSLSELNDSEAETERIEDIESSLDVHIINKKLIGEEKDLVINEMETSQSYGTFNNKKYKKDKSELLAPSEFLSISSNEYVSKKSMKSDGDDDSVHSKTIPSVDNESTVEEEIVESVFGDDDVSMNVDDEVDEKKVQKRKDAIAALTQIEIQFAKLRDKLYENQINCLDKEVDLINKGIHPELSSLMEKIAERRERKYNIAVALRDMSIKFIKDEFIAHQYEIQNVFLESKRKLREKMLQKTGEKCFRIYHERRLMETLAPEYEFSIPTKRSVQLRNRRAHELEVMFLVGLKTYIGFPAAPEIKNASKEEIMQDLSEMRVKRAPFDPFRNFIFPNSTFQNASSYNQESQLKPHNNNLFSQFSYQKSSQNRQYSNYMGSHSLSEYSSPKQHSLNKYPPYNSDRNQSSHDQYHSSFCMQHEQASVDMQLMNNNKLFCQFPLSPRLNQSLQYFEPLQKKTTILE